MRDKLYAVVIAQQINQVASIQSVRISVACSCNTWYCLCYTDPLLMGTDTGLKLKYHI